MQLRIAELEARPQLKYCGVFQAGRHYQPGEIVTWSGSAWVCVDRTSAKPGANDLAARAGWKMLVQRGRDGRDLASKEQE